jgi:hypothetical protein
MMNLRDFDVRECIISDTFPFYEKYGKIVVRIKGYSLYVLTPRVLKTNRDDDVFDGQFS